MAGAQGVLLDWTTRLEAARGGGGSNRSTAVRPSQDNNLRNGRPSVGPGPSALALFETLRGRSTRGKAPAVAPQVDEREVTVVETSRGDEEVGTLAVELFELDASRPPPPSSPAQAPRAAATEVSVSATTPSALKAAIAAKQAEAEAAVAPEPGSLFVDRPVDPVEAAAAADAAAVANRTRIMSLYRTATGVQTGALGGPRLNVALRPRKSVFAASSDDAGGDGLAGLDRPQSYYRHGGGGGRPAPRRSTGIGAAHASGYMPRDQPLIGNMSPIATVTAGYDGAGRDPFEDLLGRDETGDRGRSSVGGGAWSDFIPPPSHLGDDGEPGTSHVPPQHSHHQRQQAVQGQGSASDDDDGDVDGHGGSGSAGRRRPQGRGKKSRRTKGKASNPSRRTARLAGRDGDGRRRRTKRAGSKSTKRAAGGAMGRKASRRDGGGGGRVGTVSSRGGRSKSKKKTKKAGRSKKGSNPLNDSLWEERRNISSFASPEKVARFNQNSARPRLPPDRETFASRQRRREKVDTRQVLEYEPVARAKASRKATKKGRGKRRRGGNGLRAVDKVRSPVYNIDGMSPAIVADYKVQSRLHPPKQRSEILAETPYDRQSRRRRRKRRDDDRDMGNVSLGLIVDVPNDDAYLYESTMRQTFWDPDKDLTPKKPAPRIRSPPRAELY